MAISVRVCSPKERQQIEHDTGPLEFGRGPQRDARRVVIDDIHVSRDHARVEETRDGWVRIENLSQKNVIQLADGTQLQAGQSKDLPIPLFLSLGATRVDIDRASPSAATSAGQPAQLGTGGSSDTTITTPSGIVAAPPLESRGREVVARRPVPLTSEATVAQLAQWLQTIVRLQETSVGSAEFYDRTAQALVELIDLDLGLVLLRGDPWTIAGRAVASSEVPVRYSRTLVSHVATRRQAFYEDVEKLCQANKDSLSDVEVAVAAPILGLKGEVVGVLYGTRSRSLHWHGPVGPLDAQLVQLLAAAASTNLARSIALRTRVQFEQFFSPDLVRELENNPALLEGRSQEVTVLFSDLRGFSALSERLGPQKTCQVLRDMMECLSVRIVDNGGVIVDYAGDGILAMWNAPAEQPDHALRAARAALAMLGELPAINARWQDEARGELAIGVGINTGQALVGNTGSSRKLKYGPHGHAVNVASRVQDLTKRLALPVLTTDSTRQQLGAQLPSRRLGKVRLPGVKEHVLLHELRGEDPGPEWRMLRETYEQALAFYEAQQWSKACQTLMPLLSLAEPAGGYDMPMLKLMRRSWECFESPPKDFDPVIEE